MGLDKGHVYDSGPLLIKLPGERLAALVGQLEKQLRCKKLTILTTFAQSEKS